MWTLGTTDHACKHEADRAGHTLQACSPSKHATPSCHEEGWKHSLVVAEAQQDVSASLQGVHGRSNLYMLLRLGWHAIYNLTAAVLDTLPAS